MKQCEECEALFEESKTGRAKRFCSDECRWRWWVKHKKIGKAKTYRYGCQYCGKEFISYVKKGRKYCSARCAADAKAETSALARQKSIVKTAPCGTGLSDLPAHCQCTTCEWFVDGHKTCPCRKWFVDGHRTCPCRKEIDQKI